MRVEESNQCESPISIARERSSYSKRFMKLLQDFHHFIQKSDFLGLNTKVSFSLHSWLLGKRSIPCHGGNIFDKKTQCALPNHLKSSILKLFLKYTGFLSDISMGSIQATLRGKPAHFLVTRPWTTGGTLGILSVHIIEKIPRVAPANMHK